MIVAFTLEYCIHCFPLFYCYCIYSSISVLNSIHNLLLFHHVMPNYTFLPLECTHISGWESEEGRWGLWWIVMYCISWNEMQYKKHHIMYLVKYIMNFEIITDDPFVIMSESDYAEISICRINWCWYIILQWVWELVHILRGEITLYILI